MNLTFAIALLLPGKAMAFFELNAYYTSESLATTSTTTNNRMIIEGSIGFKVDKKGSYLVGWNYGMFSTTDTSTDTTTYTSTQMGPRFIYIIDKDQNWSIGAGYYLVTTGAYKAGSGTEEKWKGTALKLDFGYNHQVSDSFFAGLRLNYSSATYTEQLIGETTYATVSYSKTMMYPSIYTIYMF